MKKLLPVLMFVYLLFAACANSIYRPKQIDVAEFSDQWQMLFDTSQRPVHDIVSPGNSCFSIRLNRYQNPQPLMQFDWEQFCICYFDSFDISDEKNRTLNSLQIKRGNHIIFELEGNCYFNGFYLDVADYLCGTKDPYESFFHDLNGDGKAELIICTGSRGAYSYWTIFVFTIEGSSVKNILEYHSGTAGPIDNRNSDNWERMWKEERWDLSNKNQERLGGHYLKDIDNNGIPEIIMLNSAIEQLCGSTHGPRALLIIEWKNRQFIDKTRLFPRLARKTALGYLDDSKDRRLISPESVMPYYANMILAGEQKKAEAWLRRNGSAEINAWLSDKKKMQALHRALMPDLAKNIQNGKTHIR